MTNLQTILGGSRGARVRKPGCRRRVGREGTCLGCGGQFEAEQVPAEFVLTATATDLEVASGVRRSRMDADFYWPWAAMERCKDW